jgi:leucine dehydrogenase
VPDTPLVSLDHEELLIRKGRRTGIYTVVAVHSTTLGPALGGCRMWRYENSADGARDALRLSRAMTYKASVAGVNLGGGKGVICLRPGMAPTGKLRTDMLLDFGDTVGALEGRYITAEDVGTSARDMEVIERETKWVTGRPPSHGGSGDPSPFTALGVVVSMRACAQRRFGDPSLTGKKVSVVGAGRVGANLAKLLAKEGADLIVADIDEHKKDVIKKLPNAKWSDPTTALLADVDILAPCALGGVIDEVTVGKIRCDIICGAANNQLAHEGLADDLHAHGILYAPDFVANSGGLINVASEVEGYDRKTARERVRGIEQTMHRVFDEADAIGTTPLAAAYSLARQRLSAAGDQR